MKCGNFFVEMFPSFVVNMEKKNQILKLKIICICDILKVWIKTSKSGGFDCLKMTENMYFFSTTLL